MLDDAQRRRELSPRPMVEVIPPTPGDVKGKGKERAQEPYASSSTAHHHGPSYPIAYSPSGLVPPVPSHPSVKVLATHTSSIPCAGSNADSHVSERAPKTSDSPTESTGSSPPAAGSLSRKVTAILDHLYQQTDVLLIEAADAAGFSVDRVAKLLGKRLGVKMRGSGTTWNSYQNFFAAHMAEELQRIDAEEEYASASSAQKPGIVSRAQDAFKSSFDDEKKWIDVLKLWEELNVVSTGCMEQTYGSREAKFDSINREIDAIVCILSRQ